MLLHFFTLCTVLLSRFTAIAEAPSDTEYLQAVQALKNSTEWQTSSDLHTWFDNTWLAEKQVIYVHDFQQLSHTVWCKVF